jgi:hypothetical protein
METQELQHSAYQQYVAELEPLVERIAPGVHDSARGFLGHAFDLAPSRAHSARHFSPEDWVWLAALEDVAHRHQLACELVTHEGGDDTFWLVFPH